MKDIQCTNCAENGHILRNCSRPITSFGIIAFKIFYNKQEEEQFRPRVGIEFESCSTDDLDTAESDYPKIKTLMIQRKDTIGYTDFVRGKYEPSRIGTYLREMTPNEQEKLKTSSFEDIWDSLWINHKSKTYRNEYEFAKSRFIVKDVNALVRKHPSQYKYQEFGFPKGRRNVKESLLDCAIREFGEETGYKRGDYRVDETFTLVEDFKGTDNVRYKHVYYIAKLNDDTCPPYYDKTNKYQLEEIKSIGFFSLQETLALLRDYDSEKKRVIIEAHKRISEIVFGTNDVINMTEVL